MLEEISDRALQKFEKDPVLYCQKYLDKFFVGVICKESEAAKKSILSQLKDVNQQDINAIAPAAEKVKSYVKPDSEIAVSSRGKNTKEKITENGSSVEKNEISEERREQFYGNLIFYTGIHELSEYFLKSFKHHILELATDEYLKFEADPIKFTRSYVETFYTSHDYTSTKAARARSEHEKSKFNWFLNHVTSDSMAALRKSMTTPPKPVTDPGRSPEPAEKDLESATTPTTTASTQPSNDNRTMVMTNQDPSPVQNKSAEKTENSSEDATQNVNQ